MKGGFKTRSRFKGEGTVVAKQTASGDRCRYRVDFEDGRPSVYIDHEVLFDLADTLGDLCDAIEAEDPETPLGQRLGYDRDPDRREAS